MYYVLFCLSKKEPKKDPRNPRLPGVSGQGLLPDYGKQLCGAVVHSDLNSWNSTLKFKQNIYIDFL